tara:strand:+ start:3820 stop:4383 length:564 start_codon:yes stop_codon:yes gene_type:complete
MKFLNKFNNKKNIRFSSFKKTFEVCLERNLKVIVETGTSRGKTKFFIINHYNWKDGMSTPMFAEYAYNYNGELHSCDISLINIRNAKKFTNQFSQNITFYNLDSLFFLKNFNKKIDLLYLDSLDGHDIVASSQHQLNEIKIGLNKLHNKSLVLLDDKGSKTKLSINFLKDSNYKIIYETDYQVLFSK